MNERVRYLLELTDKLKELMDKAAVLVKQISLVDEEWHRVRSEFTDMDEVIFQSEITSQYLRKLREIIVKDIE